MRIDIHARIPLQIKKSKFIKETDTSGYIVTSCMDSVKAIAACYVNFRLKCLHEHELVVKLQCMKAFCP